MLHEPAQPVGKDPAGPYKATLGVRMFGIYTVIYAGFVAINILSPLTMATIVFAGLNLATVYGMVLIIGALLEALLYNWMCHQKEEEFARLARSAGAGDAGVAGATGATGGGSGTTATGE